MPDGREEKVLVTLTDEDEDLLGRYWQYSQELRETKCVREGQGVSFGLRWAGQGIEMHAEQPLPEAMGEFLLRLRPVCLQSEETYFGTIRNLVSKLVPNEQVRAVAQAQKDLFSGKRMQQQLQVTSNGVLLNSQETLEKWLNAYEYHRDKGKKAQLDALHKILPIEFSIPLFLSLLIDRAAAVLDLADLVGLIIGKTEKFEGPGC
jgi:hypothetical protein